MSHRSTRSEATEGVRGILSPCPPGLSRSDWVLKVYRAAREATREATEGVKV